MADRIVVMKDGHILQAGAPMELYENPVDVFTARFIGSPSMNILPGRESGAGFVADPAGGLQLGMRSHDLLVGQEVADPVMELAGTVVAVEPLGPETLVHFDHAGETVIGTAPGGTAPDIGTPVTARLARGKLYTFDATSGKALGRK